MVPRVYAAIRDYIDASVEFIVVVGPSGGGGSVSTSRLSLDGVGTGVAWTELEDALNRATNALFTDCLGGLLGTTIEAARSDLLRLVQLTINLSELESACEHLQTYLHENARPNLCLSSTSSKKKNSVVDDDPAGMEEDVSYRGRFGNRRGFPLGPVGAAFIWRVGGADSTHCRHTKSSPLLRPLQWGFSVCQLPQNVAH